MADKNIADGWTQQLSKTTGKYYYVHTSTGKRQWHIPLKPIEEARGKIKTYYEDLYRNSQLTLKVYESSKNFIKFIKRAIFDEFVVDLEMDVSCECKYVVLDVGCGKGEDIEGWKKLKCSSFIGFDLNEQAIIQLLHNNTSSSTMHISAFIGDLAEPEVWKRIHQLPQKMDVITSLFSLQYAFAEKESLRTFFSSIHSSLSERGRVIIIALDEEFWGKHFVKSKEEIHSFGFTKVSISGKDSKEIGSKYHILHQHMGPQTWLPEWFVPKPILLKESENADLELCAEFNLASFATFIGVGCQPSSITRQFFWNTSHEKSFKDIHGLHQPSAEAWSMASLYKCFVFRKRNKGLKCGNTFTRDFNLWLETCK